MSRKIKISPKHPDITSQLVQQCGTFHPFRTNLAKISPKIPSFVNSGPRSANQKLQPQNPGQINAKESPDSYKTQTITVKIPEAN
jgi:hypothetical protein